MSDRVFAKVERIVIIIVIMPLKYNSAIIRRPADKRIL